MPYCPSFLKSDDALLSSLVSLPLRFCKYAPVIPSTSTHTHTSRISPIPLRREQKPITIPTTMNSSFSGNPTNYSSQRSSSNTASTTTTSYLKNYNFDFGIGSTTTSSTRPLKDQKNPSSAQGKPSWTHQPAAPAPRSGTGISNPSSGSMVGDIFGKSWTSTTPASGIGLPKADPNLFGDLLGSTIGKSGAHVPLKDAAPRRDPFSTDNLSNSLPKSTAAPMRNPAYGSAGSSMNGAKIGGSMAAPSMKASASNRKTDPFGSLMDFKSKPSAPLNTNPNHKVSGGVDPFGDFQSSNVAKDKVDATTTFGMPPVTEFPSQKVPMTTTPPPTTTTTAQSNNGIDPLDMLFSSSAASATAAAAAGASDQMFGEMNDWDDAAADAGFGGGGGDGATTELEGLPPPPAGVTASVAKGKGIDNHKQGQFADAIKWLTWASVLLDKSGDKSSAVEVLACRATCYKEVGEYKKAVADCSKILEHDSENVSVLVQRALLYESTEKYKLGAEDLRAVLKIDPTNRLARTTIHRLNQLAG